MFDVYVSGVDPNKINEFEQIKKNVGATLNIEGETLDHIVSPEGGIVLIQENVSENDAIRIRKILVDIGLLCTYELRKSSRWGELSIEAVDEKSDLFTCPACKASQPLIDGVEPENCSNCHLNVSEYRESQKKKEEYEEIRKSMQLKAQARLDFEEQEKLKEDLRIRKAQMEERAAKELGLEAAKPGWKSFFDTKQTKTAYFIAASIVFIGLATYEFWPKKIAGSELDIPETTAIPDQVKPVQVATAAAVTDNVIPENAAGQQEQQNTVAVADTEIPTRDDFAEPKPTANVQELVVQEGETPAQAALAKGHSDVTKFLNSIGMEAGPTASVGGAVSKDQIKLVQTSASAQTQTLPAPEQVSSSAAQTRVLAEKRQFIEDIYREVDMDVEWESFLSKKAKEYIRSGKLKSAYLLSQVQTNLTDHIDVVSELLGAFTKLGRNDLVELTLNKLNQRIQLQPQEMQAIYKAQLASSFGNKQALFDEAEKLALGVSDAVRRSQTLSKIAVYQKTADPQASNKKFSLAEESLKGVTPSFEQFSAYISLAEDYTKVVNRTNAEVAMILAELTLSNLNASRQEEGLVKLLNVAFLMDDTALINKFSSRIQNSVFRSKAAYQSIQSQLKNPMPLSFSKQLSSISDSDYLAVASALSALFETDQTKQKSLIESVQKYLVLIEDNERKAVATSKAARYIYRMGLSKEASDLFGQALVSAQSIQKKEQRDAVLIILAMDKARIFLSEGADQIIGLISDDPLRSATSEMIKNAQSVKALVST